MKLATSERLHFLDRAGRSASSEPAAHISDVMLSVKILAATSMIRPVATDRRRPLEKGVTVAAPVRLDSSVCRADIRLIASGCRQQR
jgi:hypothetical protein